MTAAQMHADVDKLVPEHTDAIFDRRLARLLRQLSAALAEIQTDVQAEQDRLYQMFAECAEERDAARLLNKLCHF